MSWLPFFLRQVPKEGVAKGGTPADRVGDWLQRINKSEGPDVQFTGLCDRYPNTELYHVALEHVREAQGAAVQHALAGRLFKGYYQDGIYPDVGNLLALAREVAPGMDVSALERDLRDDSKAAKVVAYARQLARQMRVTGVPYFIINGEPAFSGAQEPATILNAFAEAAEL